MRSEWIELPGKGEWERVLPNWRSSFTIPREYWNLWAKDPATTQWSDGDMAVAVEAATKWKDMSWREKLSTSDRLGLNAKGRRDLRYRTQAEAAQQRKAVTQAAEVRRLRLAAERKT